MVGPLNTARRRSREPEEVDDEDSQDYLTDGSVTSRSSARSQGSKRIRLNGNAYSGERNPRTLNHTLPHHPVNGITHGEEIDLGNYQPGSIVRVKLTNFVTYTSAEFHLGPSLNMVIGPNGTGKSTLVCAICLGLGWGPNHLGRAKELGEFVRHGAREAEIEIELAAGEQQRGRNPIIRRSIKREGNKSTFYINGQLKPQKEVLKLAHSFSIQIDNLCQFLPQDRVVEFAGLSPVELLVSTQRAAAPPEMVQWHEELKQLRGIQKKAQGAGAHDKELLNSLQSRQNVQRADVDRLREREEFQVRLEALKIWRPVLEYKVARAKATEAKERKKAAQLELKQLERELEPAMAAMNAKDKYRAQIEGVIAQRKKFVDRAEAQGDDWLRKLEVAQESLNECQSQREAEITGDKTRKADLARAEQAILHIKKQMEQPPPDFDPAEFNERIREKMRKIRELETRAREINDSMREAAGQANTLKDEQAQIKEDIQNLKSQAGQQNHKLRAASKDTARAWEWVQQNQANFKGKVYGPPIVECSITDKKYADAVESSLMNADFLAFTCTNREDFRMLQDHLYGVLRLSDVSVRVANRPLEHWKSPVSTGQLQDFGLDGWIIDFLAGPDPVLSMLCDNGQIHRTGVTLRNHNDQEFERLKDSPIQSWVAGRQTHRVIRRREYGPKAVSTRVQQTKSARYWTDKAVDTTAESQLTRKYDELNDDITELKRSFEEYKDQLDELREQKDELVNEKSEIEHEKGNLQKASGEFNALPTKLASQEERLESLKERGAQFDVRISEIRKKADDLALEKGTLTLNYASHIESIRKLHSDLFDAEIRHLEAVSDLACLKQQNEDVRATLETRRREVAIVEDEHQRQNQIAHRLVRQVQQMNETRTEAHREVHDALPDEMTADDLESEIESASARLELLHGGNPDAIRQYERRAKEIENIQAKITETERELAETQQKIDETRALWEPKLEELVGKISDAFSYNLEQIGCAGQVGIHKDEDFDQWAIQIQVKFREHEQLSILDSHRQSGGERAVSTIFYLMALQSLARSPFRVVDEINQGMDPRNERMVHERMVDIACQEYTSQYFLITPKLLHGLKFHPRMKVHCIASGEYMPEDHSVLDFGKLANVALRVKGMA